MKINELLTESTELQEGPLLNKIGSGIGKAVGTAAKGVGAVAGGVAGIGRAVKKGYAAGANAVGGPGAPTMPAPGAAATAPAADQADELAQLRSQLQIMQQKLTRAGIQQ